MIESSRSAVVSITEATRTDRGFALSADALRLRTQASPRKLPYRQSLPRARDKTRFCLPFLPAVSACRFCLPFLPAVSACRFCLPFLPAVSACRFRPPFPSGPRFSSALATIYAHKPRLIG